MTSWVHVFSKFTSEALLFEGFVLCVGITLYAGWAILKKRRELAEGDQIPGSVVKVYLNELIIEAEQMRGQLYGLLQASGGQLSPELAARLKDPNFMSTLQAGASGAQAGAAKSGAQQTIVLSATDPDVANKIMMVESKMQAQAQAMDALVAEKVRLERELQLAKTSGGGGGAGAEAGGAGGSDSGDSAELKKKIQELEAKLSEYSVIEDDLANLKRLQQENSQLKVQLSEQAKAISATPKPALMASAAPVAESAPAPVTTAAPAPVAPAAAAPTGATAAPADDFFGAATSGSPDASPATLESPAVAAPTDAGFDALTQQVDASLQADPLAALNQEAAAAPAPAPVAEAAPTAPAAVAAAPTEAKPEEKSEEDLLAEFEKMING